MVVVAISMDSWMLVFRNQQMIDWLGKLKHGEGTTSTSFIIAT